ncbi:MAG TPA: methionine adenosyltransferase [Planctomycetota bacterium]|nr:methionine adenosyltransferase [Planctomycetota bacterium]
MSNHRHLFTSESVTMGHPDKVADQISDGILDAIIAQDKRAHVACETLVTTGLVMVAGEITTDCYVHIPDIVRDIVKEIGYVDPTIGFDWETCAIVTSIDRQSPDIALGVNETTSQSKEQGAGDQGLMFGFACNETPEFMPMPIMLAHRLVEKLADFRQNNILPYLRPDGKSQVTVEYDGDTPLRVHTVVISTQHTPDVEQATIRKDMIEKLIPQVIPKNLLDDKTIYHINPTGRFVVGGPHGDTGLTGRKIICDTYGGRGSHGGGAFSGKDPSKVDRSASYAARHIAKNIVAAGLATKCEVQISYAIGVAKPISLYVCTEGTSKIDERKIEKLVHENWDLRPRAIIDYYNLLRPIYKETARHGHFGRENNTNFTWERTEKADALRKAAAKL